MPMHVLHMASVVGRSETSLKPPVIVPNAGNSIIINPCQVYYLSLATLTCVLWMCSASSPVWDMELELDCSDDSVADDLPSKKQRVQQ